MRTRVAGWEEDLPDGIYRRMKATAAMVLGGLFVACGSSSPTSSQTEFSVQIQVPRQVNLTQSGSKTVTFTSEVEVAAESLTWEMAQDHFDGEPPDWTEIGQGASLEHRFSEMGTYRVRLMARSADGDLDIQEATTAVLPYLEDPEPILFFSYDEDLEVRLMRMSPTSPQPATVVASEPDFHANSLDKSPDGRLVVTGLVQGSGTRNLVIFDLQTGEVVRQITDTDHISWYPAWSPDGQELALGKARFSGEEFRRIAIIAEPWTEHLPAGVSTRKRRFRPT